MHIKYFCPFVLSKKMVKVVGSGNRRHGPTPTTTAELLLGNTVFHHFPALLGE